MPHATPGIPTLRATSDGSPPWPDQTLSIPRHTIDSTQVLSHFCASSAEPFSASAKPSGCYNFSHSPYFYLDRYLINFCTECGFVQYEETKKYNIFWQLSSFV